MLREGVQIHSFACKHSVATATFLEKTPFSPIELSCHPCWGKKKKTGHKCMGLYINAPFYYIDLHVYTYVGAMQF